MLRQFSISPWFVPNLHLAKLMQHQHSPTDWKHAVKNQNSATMRALRNFLEWRVLQDIKTMRVGYLEQIQIKQWQFDLSYIASPWHVVGSYLSYEWPNNMHFEPAMKSQHNAIREGLRKIFVSFTKLHQLMSLQHLSVLNDKKCATR